jgi:hypothetical protein
LKSAQSMHLKLIVTKYTLTKEEHSVICESQKRLLI